jgi:glutathione S-transferase
MTLLLYDHPVSNNALKVRILLAELGLEYDRRHVPFAQPRPDWYLEVNPFGLIPAIVDGDVVLAESHAILRHLAVREGRGDLYPVGSARQAHIDWALDAWAGFARPGLLVLERAVLFATGDMDQGQSQPELADPAAVEEGIARARTALAPYEAFCSADGTVCGDGVVTIADFAVAPVLLRSRSLPFDLDGEFPKLARIRDAAAVHPSVVAGGFVA